MKIALLAIIIVVHAILMEAAKHVIQVEIIILLIAHVLYLLHLMIKYKENVLLLHKIVCQVEFNKEN